MKWFRVGTVLLLVAGGGMPVRAQTPADIQIIERQQQQIIRQQQLQQRQQELDRDIRRRPPAAPERERPGEAPGQAPETCFPIGEIRLEGADHLSTVAKRLLVAPYIGKCIGLAEIQQLIRDTTNLYIDEGYITSRALIPPQDLSDGSLEIQVVEGHVEQIRRGDGAGRVNLATAFPGLEGKILNIRDIEQSLDQINRLPSNDARMRLLPGEKPGGSTVVIENDPSFFMSGSATADNNGSPGTGERKGNATIFIDNPLGLNDQLVLGYGHNLDRPTPDALNENYMADYSIPWGYWTLSGGYSYFEYSSLLRGQTSAFDTSGTGETATVRLARVVQRGKTSKTTVTASLIRKKNDNFIEDARLVTSSRVTSLADLDVVTTFYALGATVAIDVGISQGIPVLGAEDNPSLDDGPEDAFTLLHAGLSVSRAWPVGGFALGAVSALTVQYSADRLPGTEQMSVGGLFTVRGFKNRSVSGNSGFYSRNELYLALPVPGQQAVARLIGSIRPYLAVDVGHVLEQPGTGVPDGGTMVGGVVGVRAVGGRLSLDASYGIPLIYPDKLVADPDPDVFYLKATASF